MGQAAGFEMVFEFLFRHVIVQNAPMHCTSLQMISISDKPVILAETCHQQLPLKPRFCLTCYSDPQHYIIL